MENFARSKTYVRLTFEAAIDKLRTAARLGGFHWELKVWSPKSGEQYTINGLGHINHHRPPIKVKVVEVK